MAKRKTNTEDITSRETKASQKKNRKEAKRRASIDFYEMPDGRVNVDYYDSQVDMDSSGKKKSFDLICYMSQQYVFHRVKELIGHALFGVIQNYDKAPINHVAALSKADSKLDELRQLALNIKTGKGGSDVKSDPHEIQKQILNILK